MSERLVPAYKPSIVSVKQPVQWVFKDIKSRSFEYAKASFPIASWIHKYNLSWAIRDMVAGITVGCVVVPQSMSYAQVAGLPVQYGLYSSFIGVMLYCLFATSKDVSIGPVAVMSAQTYTVINRVLTKVPGLEEADAPAIGATLSLLCGGITFGIGLLRIGFILEYISMPCVLGFMTGSAFTIAAGQVPSLMGYSKAFSTNGPTYKVIVNTLKHLPDTDLNAAFGLVCLFLLYAMKFGFDYLAKRDSKRRVVWFYLGTLRAVLIIIFSTLISWGVCRHTKDGKKYPISILKSVPRGLQDVGVHPVDRKIVDALAPELPISVVVLVLEHIAISKSFGRINDYRVNPNQELIAIGVSNLVGHFFDAYPNTGSFSRTALKAKCGVKTPLAGIWTGVCVLIAIYALTDAFFWISKASLAAVIIHAVTDLVSSWRSTYRFWLISPVECIIFLVDVILCVFVSLEAGIYFSVAASLLFVLLRQTFPLGQFLGRVQYVPVKNARLASEESEENHKRLPLALDKLPFPLRFARKEDHSNDQGDTGADRQSGYTLPSGSGGASVRTAGSSPETTVIEVADEREADAFVDVEHAPGPYSHGENLAKDVAEFGQSPAKNHLEPLARPSSLLVPEYGPLKTKWWPLTHDNINPNIRVIPPPPGILVYRFRDALTYQNCAWQMERVVGYVRANTRRNLSKEDLGKITLANRNWNDGLPRKLVFDEEQEDLRPVLRAIVFDMSATPHVDLTAANALYDAHREVIKYASQPVEFHFAGILSEWAQRALINAGFGAQDDETPNYQPLLELGTTTYSNPETSTITGKEKAASMNYDVESQRSPTSEESIVHTGKAYFHFDIPDLE